MSTQKTANYQLKQWVKSDRIQMEDFNDDNSRIDQALKANADAVAAAQSALEECGNCAISLFTYKGTGKYNSANPTVITFSKMPTVFMVKGPSAFMIARGGESSGCLCTYASTSGTVRDVSFQWSGSKVSFYADDGAKYQLNISNATYWVMALNQTNV